MSASRAKDRGWLEGSFVDDVVRADGVQGTTIRGYQMKRGAATNTVNGPYTMWRDGTGRGVG